MWNKTLILPCCEGNPERFYIAPGSDSGFIIGLGLRSCEGYCFHTNIIKFDKNGIIEWHYRIEPLGGDSEPLAIFNQNERVEMILSTYNDDGDKFFYVAIDTSHPYLPAYLINADFFSLQKFVRINRLKHIQGSPIACVGCENRYIIIGKDWSLMTIKQRDTSKVLYKYDSLGRICPDYIIPKIKNSVSRTVYALLSVPYTEGTDQITISDFTVTLSPYTNPTVICKGKYSDLAEEVNKTNNRPKSIIATPIAAKE